MIPRLNCVTRAETISPLPNGVTIESVRGMLDRILSSDSFAQAEALRHLLRYLIENTIQGRNNQLKEYVLGVDVFGRGPAFDPRIDAIVRVQAGRLRRKLKQFYEQEGSSETVVIALPKGSYVPVFRVNAPVAKKEQA